MVTSKNASFERKCAEHAVCGLSVDPIGDTVNTAARLEAKAEAGEILVSEALYEKMRDRINAHFKEEMTLKGKSLPVKVYSVTGLK